jgi:hypothetical protein
MSNFEDKHMSDVPETEAECHARITRSAVEAALNTHEDVMLLEGGEYIQMWHLVVSLLEYSAHKGIDFDGIVADVKRQIASGEVVSPAFKKLVDAASRPEPQGWFVPSQKS